MVDVNHDTFESAFDDMQKFVHSASGISWGAVVKKEDGSFICVKRANRPCYGEMRRYADGTRPQDDHPGDIPHVIPFGERLAFGAPLFGMANEITEYIWSPSDSPWRRGIGKDVTLRKNKEGNYKSVVMTDTQVDPTVLANLLVTSRNIGYHGNTMYRHYQERGFSFLKSFVGDLFTNQPKGWGSGAKETFYYLNSQLDMKRFLNGESVDISNGRTWFEQEDYNRPDMNTIFGTEGENLFIHFTVRTHPASAPDDYEKYMKKLEDRLTALGDRYGF